MPDFFGSAADGERKAVSPSAPVLAVFGPRGKAGEGGPGPRHGRREPQRGKIPGVPGKAWPAEKSSGVNPNRQREQPPGVKPRPTQGPVAPESATPIFGRTLKGAGLSQSHEGKVVPRGKDDLWRVKR